ASPALELMAILAAMERDLVPPTLNYLGPAEDCPIELVIDSPKSQKVETAVSNSFAFGGLNSTLVLRNGLHD
ncbi:MAG: beta-ACP synthase, partial [Alphaproteobacteria bacterium]|nr:beta-ACP synthase [Alphaproteobacteria bacterium]